jgi:hypothetical protein
MMTVLLQLELLVARRTVRRAEVGWRAFQSYRAKVASWRVVPPASFDGCSTVSAPEQLDQLRGWASDPAQSPASRALAANVLRDIQGANWPKGSDCG